jgi:chemotaxis signal transduction protein
LVCFTAGGAAVALPLERVPEVVSLSGAAASAPRGWVGTLVRGDRPVPVADLAFLLGLPRATPVVAPRAVLLGAGRPASLLGVARYGVAADDAPTVVTVPRADFQPLSPAAGPVARTFVTAVLVREQARPGGRGESEEPAELTLVLDADAIAAALEPGVTRAEGGAIAGLRALPREPAKDLIAARDRDAGWTGLATVGHAPTWPRQVLALSPLSAGGVDMPVLPVLPVVPLEWVREVIPYRGAHAVPHAPPGLAGLVVWRGRALAALDLARVLGDAPEAVAPGARLLIVGPPGGEAVGALVVPGVRGLLTLDAPAGPAAPRLPGALARVAVAAAPRLGGTVALLDVAALLREPRPAG